MKIELREVSIRELTEGYVDSDDDGVVAYGGRLDVRPPYQREFVYDEKQRAAVLDTVVKNYPLNVLYWASRPDGTFEVIDGQQRTLSVCQYVDGNFSVGREGRQLYFFNLQDVEQAQILDYRLTVYVCTGTEPEKLAWFKTINIAGARLLDQELRNAVFAGPWLSAARKYFSKRNCAASQLGQDYLKGDPNRQELLETTLDWISRGQIDDYMGRHQHEADARELRAYFESVLAWVRTTFPTTRRGLMKGLEWGHFYNAYKDKSLDPAYLEGEIQRLIQDEDVGSQRGIYEYLLTGQERHLNLRAFDAKHKHRAYERQKGVCPACNEHYELAEMEGDHITPWHEGGKTTDANLQMLCKDDNRRKSGK